MDRSSITAENLAHHISRDPTSWNGIALLYLRLPGDKQHNAISSFTKKGEDILTLKGKNGDYVFLGTKLTPKHIADALAYSWIQNIADNVQQTYAVLMAMAEKEKTPAFHDSKTQGKLSILVVEDEPITSKFVAKQLQKFGEVATTKNAREATANTMVRNPDIIFLDIHYKDDVYDGFDVLTNILSVNPKALVVMFSANRDPATIFKALSLGAQGFIAKPFHADDFSHYLAKFAGK